jgi:hypothetical protein
VVWKVQETSSFLVFVSAQFCLLTFVHEMWIKWKVIDIISNASPIWIFYFNLVIVVCYLYSIWVGGCWGTLFKLNFSPFFFCNYFKLFPVLCAKKLSHYKNYSTHFNLVFYQMGSV